jgi:hypothetical protein
MGGVNCNIQKTIEWSIFIAKLECLLFQIISIQFPPTILSLHTNTEMQNRNPGEKKSNINRISHSDENNKYNRDVIQLKNNFLRAFSIEDKVFLKQKFTPDNLSKPNNYDATLSSEVLKKDSTKENKPDSKFTISLPAYKTFLTWWLPLLFTLRNIKNEFCCIYHSSVTTAPKNFKATPIVHGFIGRAGAIDLLKTGPFFFIFLFFVFLTNLYAMINFYASMIQNKEFLVLIIIRNWLIFLSLRINFDSTIYTTYFKITLL